MRRITRLLGAGVFSLMLAGCGGGIGDSGAGSFVTVTYFSADKNSVSVAGENFNFSFSVDYSSPSGIYIAELYYNNTPTMPSPEANFKITGLNCAKGGSVYPCGSNGQFNCTYDGYINSYPVVTCEGDSKALIHNGDVYFIIRACIYNERLQLVCDTDWVVVQIP